MAVKKNIEVRAAMLMAGLKQWEVADAIGYTEQYFSQLLRHELSQDKKDAIIDVIEKIKAERSTT